MPSLSVTLFTWHFLPWINSSALIPCEQSRHLVSLSLSTVNQHCNAITQGQSKHPEQTLTQLLTQQRAHTHALSPHKQVIMLRVLTNVQSTNTRFVLMESTHTCTHKGKSHSSLLGFFFRVPQCDGNGKMGFKPPVQMITTQHRKQT